MKILRNEKGFTLIELVLIIIVLGILSAVAIVQFGAMADTARDGVLDGSFGSYQSALAISVGLCRGYPSDTASTDADACDSNTNDTVGDFGLDAYPLVNLSADITVSAYVAGAPGTFTICSGAVGNGRMGNVSYTDVTGVGVLTMVKAAYASPPC